MKINTSGFAHCQRSMFAETAGECLVNIEFSDGRQANGFIAAKTLFAGKKKAREFRRAVEKIEGRTPPAIKLVTLGPLIEKYFSY